MSDFFAAEHFSEATYVAEMFLSRSFLIVSANINQLEADGELEGDGRMDEQKKGKYTILLTVHTHIHSHTHTSIALL